MQIKEIFVSQRRLRNVVQVPGMIQSIESDECLPKIEIWRDEVGTLQINDGHHRLVAYWLSGRRSLGSSEYLLIETDSARAKFGFVSDLILRCVQASP